MSNCDKDEENSPVLCWATFEEIMAELDARGCNGCVIKDDRLFMTDCMPASIVLAGEIMALALVEAVETHADYDLVRKLSIINNGFELMMSKKGRKK